MPVNVHNHFLSSVFNEFNNGCISANGSNNWPFLRMAQKVLMGKTGIKKKVEIALSVFDAHASILKAVYTQFFQENGSP
jgi:hypothetical protein